MAKKQTTRDDVLAAVFDDIRSKYGAGSIMVMGEGVAENVPSCPVGVVGLDRALGIGGLPKGRIVEIFGPEGGGKTTIALHYLAQIQKRGGKAAFIDAEHALSPSLARAVGVDIPKLILSQPDTAEQALDIVRRLVLSGAVEAVVVDSVAALTPQSELEGNIGDAQVGAQARLMSIALRQLAPQSSNMGCTIVFINQLRDKISTGYSRGPQETTTGGRALKFYSSVRIEVRRGKALTRGEETFGHELHLKVVKNKLSSPFRSCRESLVYGRGVPVSFSILNMAIDAGVVRKKGSWLEYKGETLGQGLEKCAEYLDAHPELAEEIRVAALAAGGDEPAVSGGDSVKELLEGELSDEGDFVEMELDDSDEASEKTASRAGKEEE